MVTDPVDAAIVRLYVERGARRYERILPTAAVESFGDSLVRGFPYGNEVYQAILAALRPRGVSRWVSPPRPEAPLLDEAQEQMLDAIGFDAKAKREVREVLADAFTDEAIEAIYRSLDWLGERLDPGILDLVLDASHQAGLRTHFHNLPAVGDREACDRALTRWVDIAFAAYLADLMVGLAKPGELQGRRSLFAAVRAFQGAAGRLAPGDHAIFATYYRDDMGTVMVAALRDTTLDEERARNEGFLERLAAAVGEETLDASAPTTLAEGQKALAWLAEWVGQPGERPVN